MQYVRLQQFSSPLCNLINLLVKGHSLSHNVKDTVSVRKLKLRVKAEVFPNSYEQNTNALSYKTILTE